MQLINHGSEYGNEITSLKNKGNYGRNMYWDNVARTAYCAWAAPFNSSASRERASCYKGGAWQITSGDIVTSKDASTQNKNTYSFKISNYDFDLDTFHFPTYMAGNGSPTAEFAYTGCFSSGHLQIIAQYPENTTNQVKIIVELSNFKATSISDTTTTKESVASDSKLVSAISVYSKGSIAKTNSFNSLNSTHMDQGYLSTAFWTQDYDSKAYMGDNIAIFGTIKLNPGSDNRLKAFNILQLFDSEAFEINGTPKTHLLCATGKEKITYLYAADPQYPDGYNTNNKIHEARMNTVQEEDLKFFVSIDDLKEAGYTCIGVLEEVRGTNTTGEKYECFKIPVKVKSNVNLAGKTVSTANCVKAWVNEGDMDDISWINGVYDEKTGKSTLEGYLTPEFDLHNDYYSKGYYTKAEFENGQLVSGDTGGHIYGNTLMILQYETKIKMSVENILTGSSSNSSTSVVNFDMSKGHRTATYTLSPSTSLVNVTNTGTSNLKILVNLEESLSAITGESTVNGTVISENSNIPTEISFTDKNVTYTVKIYVERSANGSTITYYLLDAPLGITLPDIKFNAEIGSVGSINDVNNNDRLTATAYISGDGDIRPYTEHNGNYSSTTIGITYLQAASVSEAVDPNYIELNGEFSYSLMYTNTSTNMIDKLYVWDILPFNGDKNGSLFNGSIDVTSINTSLSGEYNTVNFYYSTVSGSILEETLTNFESLSEQSIEEMLYNGYLSATGQVVLDTSGTLKDDPSYTKIFKQWGSVAQNAIELKKEDLSEESNITCIYAIIENMVALSTSKICINIKTEGNIAGDTYKNLYNNYLQGTSAASNTVYTTVLSRTISGTVWNDLDLDGIRSEKEEVIPNVEVTLLKYNSDKQKYEICTEDILGNRFSANDYIITNEEGKYEFPDLPAGEYIVAFSGEILKKYDITKYQVNEINDGTSNDTILADDMNLSELKNYTYVIKYATNTSNISLHTITDLISKNITLDNYKESLSNQDAGLCEKVEFEFTKVSTEDTTVGIGGTKFKLYKLVCEDTSHGTAYHDSILVDVNNVSSCWKLVEEATSSIGNLLTGTGEGETKLSNLVINSEYRLVETKASLNRLLPEGQWKIQYLKENPNDTAHYSLTAVGDSKPPAFIELTNNQENATELLLPNMQKYDLPFSGNIGTKIFKATGLAIIIAGIYLLLIRRKTVVRGKKIKNTKNVKKGRIHKY